LKNEGRFKNVFGINLFMTNKTCEDCDAMCCKHIAMEIDAPEDKEDFENIKWYVCHEGVKVFMKDDEWFVEFETRCKHLGKDNKCMIYDRRSEVCRGYSHDECVFHNEDYSEDLTFETIEEVEAYMKENKIE
jgi:Fe-S-cluster containining protein